MRSLTLLPFFLLGVAAYADKVAKEPEPKPETPAALAAGLRWQQGKITLKSGLATLDVPQGFRYLDPYDTETVLVKIWGNPKGKRTLGMLFPASTGLGAEAAWGVVITYEEDGFVKDNDADKIDYADMLKQMRVAVTEANKARKSAGYPAIDLVGWAQPPHYDKTSHKLYWAKELQFEGNQDHTLNYNIRVLGRRGVLVLNAVSSMKQLPEIEQQMPAVLSFVNFNDGNRYIDFNPKMDKVATYGIGALIAGKVAAKVGFFKLLAGGMIAFKKLLVLGVVAAAGLIKKLFSGKSTPTEPVQTVSFVKTDA